MAFGINEGIALAGGIGSWATQRSAQKAQKEALRRQAQGIGLANETYRATQPYYLRALSQLAANAGLQEEPGVTRLGPNQFALGAAGGDDRAGFGMGGRFGTRATQLRLQAGQEGIERLARMRGNVLGGQMRRQGLTSGAQAAALARNEQAAMNDYARFRRQLEIQTEQDEQQKLAMLMSALGPGFNQGAQAMAGYGQQAGVYGQQANSALAGLGQLVQDYSQRQALQDYMRQYGVMGGGGDLGIYGELGGPTYALRDVKAPTIAPAPYGPTLAPPPGPWASGFQPPPRVYPYNPDYNWWEELPD